MTADVRGFYAELGVSLPAVAGGTMNVTIACFASPEAHRHDDKNKSAAISVVSGAWQCHGCGSHGGAYDAALALGKAPRDAMTLLKRHGLTRENGDDRAPRPKPPAVTEEQVGTYRDALLASAGRTARLAELRGWNREVIERFEVGYHKGYANPRGGGPIVFPSRDERGALTGCVHYQPNPEMRAEGASKSWATGPRQLFPAPETIEGDVAWVVEGEGDALAAHSAGLPAVGVPGVEGWKDAWCPRFARFRTVVVCPDADEPGQRLAERLAEALSNVVELRRLDLHELAEGRDGFDLTDAVLDAQANGGVEHLRELLLTTAANTSPDVVAKLPQPKPPRAATEGRRITLTTASDVEPEAVRWAWQERLPLGALSLIAGQPGLGKSTLTAFIAAQLTRGELEGSLVGKPCDVLLVTLEDHIAAVVRPRLEAAGANLDRVHFLGVKEEGQDGLLTLPDDLCAIEEAADRLQARLLVIDPIVATLSKATDAHKDQSVRRALAPLASYAERAGIAVAAVMHLNKQEADGLLNRVSGSVGFGGAARAVLGFLRDPDDADGEVGYERLLLPVKSNWGQYPRTLKCRIETASVETKDGPSRQSVLGIIGESDLTQADLAGNTEPGEGEEADEFLDEQLDDGSWHLRKDLKKLAEGQRLAWRTVERAAKNKGVERERRGEFHAASEWRLTLAPTPLARVDGASAWRECANGSTEPNVGEGGSTCATHTDDGASGRNEAQTGARTKPAQAPAPGRPIEAPATLEQEGLLSRLTAVDEGGR